jgi:mercuric ion binding protein
MCDAVYIEIHFRNASHAIDASTVVKFPPDLGTLTMRSLSSRAFAALTAMTLGAAVAAIPTAALGAVTVTVSDMHLCCPGCTKAVEKSVAKLEGVKVKTSQKERITVLEAADLKAAQKALDAIAEAGFCGTIDNEELKFAEVKAPEGKVTRLEIYQIHNCCGACTKAIKGALAKVEGVKADTCKAKETEFVVEGNFSAEEAVAAMLKAGFYVSLEKPKEKPVDKSDDAQVEH